MGWTEKICGADIGLVRGYGSGLDWGLLQKVSSFCEVFPTLQLCSHNSPPPTEMELANIPQNENVRRRISKACDMCRARKIKVQYCRCHEGLSAQLT